MHGEYKPPGGKLVAADVEVADGRLARAQVRGDFSLKPDDALDRLNAALTGIPAVADASGTTARITAVLGDDAVLAGFTAGAVATPVRRALTRAGVAGGELRAARGLARAKFAGSEWTGRAP